MNSPKHSIKIKFCDIKFPHINQRGNQRATCCGYTNKIEESAQDLKKWVLVPIYMRSSHGL